MSLVEIRQECRKYAERFIDLQRTEFKRLGILAEWNAPYLTMSHEFEAAIARTFAKFVERGSIYKGLKPVHWCISCQTALAEAEVEYEDHSSPSVYVKFPVTSDLSFLDPVLKGRRFQPDLTMTPWTLPANLGAFNAHLDYSAVAVGDEVTSWPQTWSKPRLKVWFPAGGNAGTVQGKPARRLEAKHPFGAAITVRSWRSCNFGAGTGCIHTAWARA
jgi:isoleucyl-tRNA synthetase